MRHSPRPAPSHLRTRMGDARARSLWMLAMTLQIEPRHDLSPNELDAIEDRLYDHNSRATGRHDGRGLGFVIRDNAGQMVGVAAGYTWAGTSELQQMWIDAAYRERGYARALISAFVEEACSRGVRRIWVASHDFQAPRMYEKADFKRVAEFEGWPEGHVNAVLCKTLHYSIGKTDRPISGQGSMLSKKPPKDETRNDCSSICRQANYRSHGRAHRFMMLPPTHL